LKEVAVINLFGFLRYFFVAVAIEKCLNSDSFVSWINMGKVLVGEEKN
jgi:hypothetical protein